MNELAMYADMNPPTKQLENLETLSRNQSFCNFYKQFARKLAVCNVMHNQLIHEYPSLGDGVSKLSSSG